MPPFRAQFDGYCASSCGHRIHPGDMVEYDDERKLHHVDCSPKPDPTTLAPTEVVCGICWLVKPCRCDED